MSTDSLFVKISSLRSETLRLCNTRPSAALLSRLEACDAALRYLRGTSQESVRRETLHGNLRMASLETESGAGSVHSLHERSSRN
jgi:hypothetical protein